MISVEPVSETCLIIYFTDPTDLQFTRQFTQQIMQLTRVIEEELAQHLVDIIPSYTSILIQYRPRTISYQTLETQILERLHNLGQHPRPAGGKTIILPVYYDVEVGPDLKTLADERHLTQQQVIDLHSQQSYTVCAIGFAPGFAFLGAVDALIAAPRHIAPRQRVPAGSVGIANRQTAVYPDDSPGGWQIIGNCPLTLFSAAANPMSPFEVGDTVRFEPIERQAFLQQGGAIWPDWK